ncbi:MAG: hypothetical protein QM744_16200 [Mesorhizobium sp.]
MLHRDGFYHPLELVERPATGGVLHPLIRLFERVHSLREAEAGMRGKMPWAGAGTTLLETHW